LEGDFVDEISFSMKYKDFVTIKRMEIDNETKPEEIVALLASIADTLVRKSFDYSEIRKSVVEDYAKEITKGKRKSFANLVEIFSKLKNDEVKENLLKACNGREELLPIAEALFMRKLLENLGYNLQITTEMMGEIYPYLKIPKPKGRFKK
jgi:hypothetical protein